VLRAQHIDGQGRALWGDRGLDISRPAETDTANYEFHYNANSDSAGGALVAWGDPEEHVTYAQRIDSAGNKLWPGKGAETGMGSGLISPSDEAVFFSTGDQWSGESRVQKVSLDGKVLWGENGIRLDGWRKSDPGVPEQQ
jgi:hypothetical protein